MNRFLTVNQIPQ